MSDNKKSVSRRDVAKLLGAAAGLSVLETANAAQSTPTPEQVEGPFHPVTPHTDTDHDMTMIEGQTGTAVGDVILVRGRVLNTEGRVLPGAKLDLWQANHFGRYTHPDDENTAPLDPNFEGWSLLTASDNGSYGLKTILPGAYPLFFFGMDGWRCRHIHFKVSHPGYQELTTQMYFAGDPWIEHDEEIAKAPESEQHLLIANSIIDEESGLPLYRFDVTLAKA
jgi:protocatechuate 3,4-dioxygenase beta subunit